VSRRVYEVARELELSTKEVMGRLNDAGVEVTSNLSVVEDPAYEKVFGDPSGGHGAGSAASNGRPEAHAGGPVPRRVRRPLKRSRAIRALAYVLIAALVFVLATGVGAVAALVI